MGLLTLAKRWQSALIGQCCKRVMDHLWDPTEAAKWSRQLAANYVQLSQSDASGKLWRAAPKLRTMRKLFEYLSFSCGNPSGFCEYMDEDFVSAMAELATRRGGANAHKANTQNLIDKYRALLHLGRSERNG